MDYRTLELDSVLTVPVNLFGRSRPDHTDSTLVTSLIAEALRRAR